MEYWTIEELAPMVKQALKEEEMYLAKIHGCKKILFGEYSKNDIGRWLKLNGYKKIRKQIGLKRRYYYIKEKDIVVHLFY